MSATHCNSEVRDLQVSDLQMSGNGINSVLREEGGGADDDDDTATMFDWECHSDLAEGASGDGVSNTIGSSSCPLARLRIEEHLS